MTLVCTIIFYFLNRLLPDTAVLYFKLTRQCHHALPILRIRNDTCIPRLHPGNHHATSVRKQCSLRCIKVHAIVKCVRLFLDKYMIFFIIIPQKIYRVVAQGLSQTANRSGFLKSRALPVPHCLSPCFQL